MEMPSEEEALDILLAYTGKKKEALSETEMAAAKDICAKMGNLPLALEILGRVASFDGFVNLAGNLCDYLNRMEETHAKAETSIKAAFALATQKYDDPLAKEALPYLAYLSSEGIDSHILSLAMEIEEIDAAKALTDLARFSVVKPREEGGYTVHRLTQEVARAEDKGDKVGQKVAGIVTAIVEDVSSRGTYKDGYFLIPHLVHLAGLADAGTPMMNFPDILKVSIWSTYIWKIRGI